MILGESDPAGARTTLDDLFRRAGVRRPDDLALVDPPNRASVTGGAPRALTFAQADRAISAMAANLRALGLQTDTVVAIQLAHTVDSVIALLGVLRAGMIAVPVPLLWRQQEMVDALGRIGAKVIITNNMIGRHAHAEIAMQTAVELFPIRYVCGFGPDLPDGVVPLDDIFAQTPAEFAAAGSRPGNPAAHVAVVTFDVNADGMVPVARNHMELIAGGLATYLASGLGENAPVLSTIPLGSFAGLSQTLLPWLLGGGALHLHRGFDLDAFAAQMRALDGGTVILPAPALAPLHDIGLLAGARTIVALWRHPERLAAAPPWQGDAALIDVASFGETGVLAARRGSDGMASAIPSGAIGNPRGAAGAVTVAEAMRTKAGTLALRGPMVPANAFPPRAERGHAPHLAVDDNGFVDTGFTCRLDRGTQTLTVTGAPGPLAAIGGYRFPQHWLDALIADADPAATIVALPDAMLGQRLAGSAPDRERLQAELQGRGVNPLIVGAFRRRGEPDAA